jgi:hypothetical protein
VPIGTAKQKHKKLALLVLVVETSEISKIVTRVGKRSSMAGFLICNYGYSEDLNSG